MKNLKALKKIHLFFTYLFLLISTSSFSQYTTLLNFEGIPEGYYPSKSLLYDGVYLYGMTDFGGINDLGTIFKILPDGTGYEKLLDFAGATNGTYPKGTLITDGTYLYGMTQQGGSNNLGTIFKIKGDGTGFERLFDFTGATTGKHPNGTLYSDGTFLYGMTNYGGASDLGAIFKIKPDGTNFIKLMDMNGYSTGKDPEGPLISDGTFLYGVAPSGSSTNYGTIFKIKPDGTAYEKLETFNGGSEGITPVGSPIFDGTFLYGMTTYGGVNSQGTIYKIKPDGSGFENIHDFAGGTLGSYPLGTLISDDEYFYGTTWMGGLYGLGTIFKIKTDGTAYEILIDFDGTNKGASPKGYLVSDSYFLYGMARSGGTDGLGVVFKYHPPGFLGTDEINSNSTSIYPNPTSETINIKTSMKGFHSVSIKNILDEEVLNKEVYIDANTPFAIDLTNQPSGVYLLRIDNSIEKFIKL